MWIRIDLTAWIRICIDLDALDPELDPGEPNGVQKLWIRIRIETNADPKYWS